MTTPLPPCPLCGCPSEHNNDYVWCSAEACEMNYPHFCQGSWLKLCRAEPPKPPEPELLPCPICGHLPMVEKGIVACGSSICPMHIHWFNESTWSEFPRQHIGGPTIPPKLAEALREWRRGYRVSEFDFGPSINRLCAAIDAEPLLKPKP